MKTRYYIGMNLGQIQSEVLRRLWIKFEEDDQGAPKNPTVAFQKYSETTVNRAVNYALAKLVGPAKLINSFFVVTLKTGYSQYSVPENCIEVRKVWYFSSATDYVELPLHSEDTIETLVPGWRTNNGTPEYSYIGHYAGTLRKVGVAPAPSSDGTAITYASGVYDEYGPYGAAEAISGSAALASAGTTFVDSEGRNLSELGVFVGQTLLNVSDGSRGVITAISTTSTTNDTLACGGGFTGGAVNTWSAGDEMRVIGGEQGGVVKVGQTDPEHLMAANYGVLPHAGLTMAAGNVLCSYYALPVLLVDKWQYPELPAERHMDIVYGAAFILGQSEPVESDESKQIQLYGQLFNGSVEDVKSDALPFEQLRFVSDRRYYRNVH